MTRHTTQDVDSRHKQRTRHHIVFPLSTSTEFCFQFVRTSFVSSSAHGNSVRARPLAVICCRAIAFEINEKNKKIRRKKMREKKHTQKMIEFQAMSRKKESQFGVSGVCVCAESKTPDQRLTMCHVMPLAVGSLANVTRQCFDIEYNQNDSSPRPQCVRTFFISKRLRAFRSVSFILRLIKRN